MLMKYKQLNLLLNIWHTEAAKTGALFCKISPVTCSTEFTLECQLPHISSSNSRVICVKAMSILALKSEC